MISSLAIGIHYFQQSWPSPGHRPIWSRSLLFTTSHSASDADLLRDLILSNLPQLSVSISNVLYNSSWTTIALCSEYKRYSSKRRGLRVSHPCGGAQRTTYRLSMPYRHIIPQTVAWATLHFLLSETLTSSFTNVRDALGRETNTYISTMQWMPGTSLLAILLYAVMNVALLSAVVRKYRDSMPLASTCSAAISAACHPLEANGVATHETDALRYGHNRGMTEKGAYRAAFSAADVRPLLVGARYQ